MLAMLIQHLNLCQPIHARSSHQFRMNYTVLITVGNGFRFLSLKSYGLLTFSSKSIG